MAVLAERVGAAIAEIESGRMAPFAESPPGAKGERRLRTVKRHNLNSPGIEETPEVPCARASLSRLHHDRGFKPAYCACQCAPAGHQQLGEAFGLRLLEHDGEH